MFSVLPASLISSTYTDRNSPFARLTNKHSQLKTFLQPCSNRTFSNCRSHNSPARKWPYKFLFERNDWVFHTGPRFWPFVLWQTRPNVWIFWLWNKNNVDASSILTWVYVDPASAACPEHPGSLEIMSMTFAAVIWDANDPCSVNTAYDPESSFTISPRSTTRPLYFWCFVSNSAFFKWQMSISGARWTFAPFVLASSITSFLLLTFVRSHAGIFSNFSHS